jgi:dynein heavy chain
MNDLLASGEIADLFSQEDMDQIIGNVRGKVKSAGLDTSNDGCWSFFMGNVKRNLHVCLCFSPVGSDFRRRSTQFPALVNNVVIDWFHPWPQDALLDVATKFLEETDLGADSVRESVIKFMPYSFGIVQEYSALALVKERKYIYTTPKSYLELISLFSGMLSKKKK